MKSVIVTEKPSVAMEFAKVLGVTERNDGYMENDKYIITWCIGHLIEMAYPEVYDPEMKKWDVDTLPFLPEKYIYQVIPDVKKQFNIIKRIYNRNDIGCIYYAGDPGREGIYIQMLVRQEAGHNPSAKELVIWIDSQTKEEILRGIREAGPLADKMPLADSGYMRAIEDYAFGLNFTRLLTLKYGNLLNNACGGTHQGALSVGRVMTCVLGMIVKREREIENFIPTKFYKIANNLRTENGMISAGWRVTSESKYYNSAKLYNETGFLKEEDAKAAIAELPNTVIIDEIEKKEEKKAAPLLFNLAELQAECSKKIKISPDETLAIAQSLYEKKLTTYPRTDCRVLSSAIAKVIETNIKGLKPVEPVIGIVDKILSTGSYKSIEKTRYTDDSKVTDHYALIPTGKTAEYDSLSEKEKEVYDLIVRRFLSIFCPPAVYEKVKLTESAGKEKFYATATVLVRPGYMIVAGIPEQKEDTEAIKSAIEVLTKGSSYPAEYAISYGETKPPKRYTSGSIVLAMENAGQLIEDEELREQIKGTGIGTSATRAETFKKLVANGYIALNKKTQVLTPAMYGNMVYEVVEMTMPDLLSPKMTASWEKGLEGIVSGKVTQQEYRSKLENYIRKKTADIKEEDKCHEIHDKIVKFAKVKEFNNEPGQMVYKAQKVKKSEVNTYIEIPYDDRNEAKELGARFDGTTKCWYIPKGVDESKFSKWKKLSEAPKTTDKKKFYIYVPYDDRNEAKELGARFDGQKRQWYFIGSSNKEKFKKWEKKKSK